MNIWEMINSINAGGFVAVLVLIFSLIEVSPIKVSPLKWIGNRINSQLETEIKEINTKVEKLDTKLNNHMVESYRREILEFADNVMRGKIYTHDKWKQMLKSCASYEYMIETEHLINGDATEAIEYIKEEYRKCCSDRLFRDFPTEKK